MYSHATIIGLLLVIGILAHAAWGIYQKKQLTEVTKASAERELAALDARTRALETDVTRLSSDQGTEAELRTKFQIAKPDEGVIVIIDEATSSQSAATRAIVVKRNFWQFIKEFFRAG